MLHPTPGYIYPGKCRYTPALINSVTKTSKRNRKAAGPIGNYWFELWDGADPETAVLLANGEPFTKQEDREKSYKRIQTSLTQINENEGWHLVEHLLLRPKTGCTI
jgi:hypothetical protein